MITLEQIATAQKEVNNEVYALNRLNTRSYPADLMIQHGEQLSKILHALRETTVLFEHYKNELNTDES